MAQSLVRGSGQTHSREGRHRLLRRTGSQSAWSPDNRWIAYTKILPSHFRAVFVYSLDTAKSTQITDGMSDTRFAVFDKNGKYLYFAASTNSGPAIGGLDMSSDGKEVTRSVYLIVLAQGSSFAARAGKRRRKSPRRDKKDADNSKDAPSRKDAKGQRRKSGSGQEQ